MRQAVHVDVDLTGLVQTVGRDTYARGTDHLRRHGVGQALWNAAARSLVGTVPGSRRGRYSTTARFSAGPVMRFERGRCSCPMQVNCKHVVALVMSVTSGDPVGSAAGPAPERWERALQSLFAPPTPAGPRGGTAAPLAIELALAQPSSPHATDQPGHRLLARVVRPGRNGWVAADLSWSGLGSLSLYGGYLAEHVRVL